MKEEKVEISKKTIVFTVLFLISLWFLYYIRDIIMQVFVALLLMIILNPLVKRLSRFKIPRPVSIMIVYLLVFGVFAVSLASVAPHLVEQTTNFAVGLPKYLANLGISPRVSDQLGQQLLSGLGNIPGQVVQFTVKILSNVVVLLTILTFAFYLLLTRDTIQKELSKYLGERKSKEVDKIISELEYKLGGWARGQFLLMLSVGTLMYVGLVLLGIPYSLPLAILAGILEAVPYVGPILSAIPSVVIGFGISPLMGLSTTALAFLIQQLENLILVPKIMEKSAGISPIVILLGIAIGFRLSGVSGVLVSVPVIIIAEVLLQHYILKEKTH